MKRIKNYFFVVFLLHCTTIAFTQKSGRAVFHSLTNEDGLSQSMVTSICRDQKGIMWFGTRDGLNRYNGNHFKIFRHEPGNPQSISSNHITSILSDSSGFLWIGTMGGGINKFDPRTEICKKIHFTHQEGKNVDTSHVVCLLLDSSGNIWGGTKNNGLLLIEPKTHRTEIIPVKSATNPEKNVFIKDMLEDGELIYLATGDEGLIKFLPGQGIVEYIRDFDKSQKMNYDSIICMAKGRDEYLWLGTRESYLHKYNTNTGTSEVIIGSDDKKINFRGITDLIFKGDDSLYIATSTGALYLYLIRKDSVWMVSESNNQSAIESYPLSTLYLDCDNILWAGSYGDGLKYHHSGDIDAKSPDPVPLFSKFYIYNDEVQPDTVLVHKKHLVIDPDDDFLTFEVAAINYLFPEDNYFQYMIPQFSTEWINLGSNLTIPLINLKPGKYILKLRVSSDNQSWQVNEASLTLFVLPYFYETLWFKIGAFLMTAMVLIGMFLIRVNLLKRQEIKLQTLVDQQTSKLKDTNFQLKEEVVIRRITENQLREANATKDKFFSIIAHDLRNPFNALLGLTEILYDQWDELSDPDKLEMIDTIRKDSENTYKLLVNLLDWSKIQKGAMKPKIEKTNLKETISNTLMELAANVDMKSIRVFNELLNHSYVAADQFMLKTIFRNILSNAIKFTPKEGQIVITSQQKERSVICVVSDTGVGMSESKRKKLFSVENTQSDPGTDGEIGTGLGLVITYEFVRLLDGKIWVESLHGKGTKFFVLIPKSF